MYYNTVFLSEVHVLTTQKLKVAHMHMHVGVHVHSLVLLHTRTHTHTHTYTHIQEMAVIHATYAIKIIECQFKKKMSAFTHAPSYFQ